ncbi:MAG: amidohydrolase [Candidatus Cloacimonetes bacterium]|nr:amidohydrolase [Candidatus Cloacimonadota bacterium]
MPHADLLIDNAHIVTMNSRWDEFPRGAVACADGRIIEVGDSDELCQRHTKAPRFDGGGKLLLPGFINAHTHVAMAYFKGLADDLVLQTWLQDHIWPAEQRFLSDQFVHHASLHGAAEMLRGGTTTFCDMYFYEAATARACRQIGIRAHLGEGILSFPAHGHADAAAMIAYNVKYAAHNDDRVRFELAPHAIYTCNRDDLLSVARAAREHGLRVHIHLSETESEVNDCIEKHGMRPVHYLQELGLLGPHVRLAHCVWVDDEEAAILAETGTAVALCTRSHLKLASGFAPLQTFLRHGVKLALGTDSVASNNTLSMFAEMSLVARLHKTLSDDPTFLPAREVVAMCTRDSAAALQRDDLGVVEAGRQADLTLLATDSIEATPLYDVYSHIVYTLGASDVSDVFVGGEHVLRNRKLANVDERELVARARDYAKKVVTQ